MTRFLIPGLVVILSISLNATAQNSAKVKAKAQVSKTKVTKLSKRTKRVTRYKYPKLLTYRQMGAMTPKARTRYLQQVRNALVQMEGMQNKMLKASGKFAMTDQLKELWAQLNWMDRAFAQEVMTGVPFVQASGSEWALSCTPPLVFDVYLKICYAMPRTENPVTAEDCGTGVAPISYRVSPNGISNIQTIKRCVPQAAFEAMDQVSLQAKQLTGTGPLFLRKPDEGVQKYPTRDRAMLDLDGANIYSGETLQAVLSGAPASVNQRAGDTWQEVVNSNLPTGRAATEVAGAAEGPEVVPVLINNVWHCTNNEAKAYKFNPRFGTCTSKEFRGCDSTSEGVTVTLEGTTDELCVPTASYLALSEERRSKLCGKIDDKAAIWVVKCVASKDLPSVTTTDEAAVADVLGGIDSSATDKVVPVPAGEAAGEILAAGGTCEWQDIPNCSSSPSSDKALRREFRKMHDENPAFAGQNFSICMFAGNFSRYKDNKAQSGQCLPPRSMGDNLKCSSRSEVICNPVIFGLNGGAPICVPAKGESTKACAASVPEIFEPAQSLVGEAWDGFTAEFEKSFKQYCIPGQAGDDFANKFQAYFCNECNAIGKTIVDAQVDFARQLNLCEAVGAPATDATATEGGEPAAGDSERIFD